MYICIYIKKNRAKVFGRHIFNTKLVDNFSWRFENDFNLQYSNVLSIEFSRPFLIPKDFLPRNGKMQKKFFSRQCTNKLAFGKNVS